MIRLLLKLLKIEFEPCKACETLREQLEISNIERADLLKTILGFVKPEIEQVESQRPVLQVQPIINRAMPFRQRAQLMENEDRNLKRVLDENARKNANITQSEKIENLEEELLGDTNAEAKS